MAASEAVCEAAQCSQKWNRSLQASLMQQMMGTSNGLDSKWCGQQLLWTVNGVDSKWWGRQTVWTFTKLLAVIARWEERCCAVRKRHSLVVFATKAAMLDTPDKRMQTGSYDMTVTCAWHKSRQRHLSTMVQTSRGCCECSAAVSHALSNTRKPCRAFLNRVRYCKCVNGGHEVLLLCTA